VAWPVVSFVSFVSLVSAVSAVSGDPLDPLLDAGVVGSFAVGSTPLDALFPDPFEEESPPQPASPRPATATPTTNNFRMLIFSSPS
jgi:hypothetical protein